MMTSINYEELDEHDRRLLEENLPNEEFLLYKPPAPPQSSQTEKYIENLLGAQTPDYVVARGRPLSQTADKDESVPRIPPPPQESKKSKKRKRGEQKAHTKTDHDVQGDIVNFTSKKQKEVQAQVTTPSTTDQSLAVMGTGLLTVPQTYIEVAVSEPETTASESAVIVSEPEVIVQPISSPVVQPAVQEDINARTHSLRSNGPLSDPDPQRWLLNINKIVAEHSVLEGNARTLEKKVHELQTQLSGKEILARKITGFGADIDRIQRSMREGRSHNDQALKEFTDLRKEQTIAIKDLEDLQLKSNTLQRDGVQLCRDYKSQVEQLQNFNKHLTDQLSEKVGLLSEERDRHAQLHRELTTHVNKWERCMQGLTKYADKFAWVMEKVDKQRVGNNETTTDLCVAVCDLQKAFSDREKDLASEEARDKAMRVLEEVKTAVTGLATNNQGQEIAHSVSTLSTTLFEKLDAVLVHGQDQQTNASLSAEIMCLNSRITNLNEEKGQLKKDLDTANEIMNGLRVQFLARSDNETRLNGEVTRLQERLSDRDHVPVIAGVRKALEEKMTADLEAHRAELSSEFKKLSSVLKAAVANGKQSLKYDKLKTQELVTAAGQADVLKEELSNAKQANDHLSRKTEEATRETNEYKERLQQTEARLQQTEASLQQTEASLQQAEQRLQQPETRPSTLTAQRGQQSLGAPDDEPFSDLSEVPSSEVGRIEQASQSMTTRPNTASKRLPSGSGRNTRSAKDGDARSVDHGDERGSEGPAEGTDEETQGSLYVDSQSQQARAERAPVTKTPCRPVTRAAKSSARSGTRYENRFDQELRS